MSWTMVDGETVETRSIPAVTRGMRDGVEVHKAALAAGLSTRLLPRQVLQVFGPGGVQTAFTHGIPQGSSLAGVTFTQDLRMRRGLLGKAGVAQPRGATFSVGRSRRAAAQFAARVGYPVVVKPALGDSTIDVTRGVQDRSGLRSAIDALLTPPEDRPDSTQAAYGITELRAPGNQDGRVTVPPGYRFLVEEEVPGDYLRVLVLDGEVLDVVPSPGGPWSGRAEGSLPAKDHPTGLAETVRAVVEALPGLAVLSVDVVVPEDGESELVVVDVSERPWLELQHRISEGSARQLAHALLESGMAEAGLTAQDLSTTQSLKGTYGLTFQGIIDPAEFCTDLASWGVDAGIDLELEVTDAARGHVGGQMSADLAVTVEFVESLLTTGVSGQTAMKADVEPRT
ncbi:hypothetical protein [Nesterenkonia sp. PF2B19]|uniref:hypothetical protein n=1 Tax=Nesterenkonia sp. PF2B19 TaxID=1881858 RepID=UPI000871D8C1|nr:hypothetical protein [Nesterenkonia sp. PF2B19]OSM42636.1 hypothetical protein BCY76_013200 [Nesterenkonia sp. PF2B19]